MWLRELAGGDQRISAATWTSLGLRSMKSKQFSTWLSAWGISERKSWPRLKRSEMNAPRRYSGLFGSFQLPRGYLPASSLQPLFAWRLGTLLAPCVAQFIEQRLVSIES